MIMMRSALAGQGRHRARDGSALVDGVLVALTVLAALHVSATAAPRPVRVAKVEGRAIVATIPVAGTVHSRNDQQITAGIDGQIVAVAEPGTKVRRGQVVARLDETPLKLLLKEQQAQIGRAQARLRFLDAQLARQSELRKSNHVTDFDLEQAQLDRSVAVSDLRIARARARQTKDRLRRAAVRAQFSGVVVERQRRAGEDVARGTVLARLADLRTLEVRALVPVKYGARLKRKSTVNVFAFEQRFRGRIQSIVPSLNPRAQTIEVRVGIPRPARRELTIGQLVSVAVPIRGRDSKQTSIAVPRDALILRQEGVHVFRIRSDSVAERVVVEAGDGEGEWVAVRGPLEVGDYVAVRGAETLKDGQEVAVIEEVPTTRVN